MKIYGGVYYSEDGISTSVRSMHLQTNIMNNINDNLNGFDKVGYQRKENVVSSFAEFFGAHALSTVKDEGVGRIYKTKKPLDFALGEVGYFQYKTPDGIKMTRDGRFSIDKNGYLLTLDGHQVLSRDGMPIKFNKSPEKHSDVKVSVDGEITMYDRASNRVHKIADMAVVLSNGTIADDVDVRQGYVEASNVRLQDEFFHLIPVRRNFEANRQLFLIQNEKLSKTIQELGKA